MGDDDFDPARTARVYVPPPKPTGKQLPGSTALTDRGRQQQAQQKQFLYGLAAKQAKHARELDVSRPLTCLSHDFKGTKVLGAETPFFGSKIDPGPPVWSAVPKAVPPALRLQLERSGNWPLPDTPRCAAMLVAERAAREAAEAKRRKLAEMEAHYQAKVRARKSVIAVMATTGIVQDAPPAAAADAAAAEEPRPATSQSEQSGVAVRRGGKGHAALLELKMILAEEAHRHLLWHWRTVVAIFRAEEPDVEALPWPYAPASAIIALPKGKRSFDNRSPIGTLRAKKIGDMLRFTGLSDINCVRLVEARIHMWVDAICTRDADGDGEDDGEWTLRPPEKEEDELDWDDESDAGALPREQQPVAYEVFKNYMFPSKEDLKKIWDHHNAWVKRQAADKARRDARIEKRRKKQREQRRRGQEGGPRGRRAGAASGLHHVRLRAPGMREALVNCCLEGIGYGGLSAVEIVETFRVYCVERLQAKWPRGGRKFAARELWRRRDLYLLRIVTRAWREDARKMALLRRACLRKVVGWRWWAKGRVYRKMLFRVCFWPLRTWRIMARARLAREKAKFLRLVWRSLVKRRHCKAWFAYASVRVERKNARTRTTAQSRLQEEVQRFAALKTKTKKQRADEKQRREAEEDRGAAVEAFEAALLLLEKLREERKPKSTLSEDERRLCLPLIAYFEGKAFPGARGVLDALLALRPGRALELKEFAHEKRKDNRADLLYAKHVRRRVFKAWIGVILEERAEAEAEAAAHAKMLERAKENAKKQRLKDKHEKEQAEKAEKEKQQHLLLNPPPPPDKSRKSFTAKQIFGNRVTTATRTRELATRVRATASVEREADKRNDRFKSAEQAEIQAFLNDKDEQLASAKEKADQHISEFAEHAARKMVETVHRIRREAALAYDRQLLKHALRVLRLPGRRSGQLRASNAIHAKAVRDKARNGPSFRKFLGTVRKETELRLLFEQKLLLDAFEIRGTVTCEDHDVPMELPINGGGELLFKDPVAPPGSKIGAIAADGDAATMPFHGGSSGLKETFELKQGEALSAIELTLSPSVIEAVRFEASVFGNVAANKKTGGIIATMFENKRWMGLAKTKSRWSKWFGSSVSSDARTVVVRGPPETAIVALLGTATTSRVVGLGVVYRTIQQEGVFSPYWTAPLRLSRADAATALPPIDGKEKPAAAPPRARSSSREKQKIVSHALEDGGVATGEEQHVLEFVTVLRYRRVALNAAAEILQGASGAAASCACGAT
ncbi:hypothetical protein JL720_12065 [Aureococcus anophagefferens]|nr:hypothetical protein JL720_12065 [Aureococcus anophagefferens]